MTKEQEQDLMERAWQARTRAYAPYSHFPVGAVVLGNDGKIYEGCNIENASFGATNCAERTAIFHAVAHGCTSIVALAVAGPEEEPIWPCGICRQVLSEWASPHTLVLLSKTRMTYTKTTVEELLPHAFKNWK